MRYRRILAAIGVAVSLHAARSAAAPPPDLGAASSFAVLAKEVQSSGTTVITGNAGGDRVNGFPPGVVQLGTVLQHGLRDAERDFASAYQDIASRSCSGPGVRCVESSGGTITLNGEPDTIWIFRTNEALVFDRNTTVLLLGGGDPNRVYWLAARGATIGAGSSIIGNVLTPGDITVGEGVTVNGRLLSGGNVTLANDRVSLCCAPITLQPLSLPAATAGKPYDVPLTASGGVGPYTFRVSSGTLPSTFNLLHGTPLAARHYEFTITATDSRGCSGTAAYVLDVAPCTTPLELPPLPAPVAGVPYSATLTPADATFTISGALPAGLCLTGNTITGTPAASACSSTFTITATDAFGCTGSRTYTFCFPLTFSPATLPAACVGSRYQPSITASCGAVVITQEVTPMAAGPFSYPVKAVDPIAACGTSTYEYLVEAVGPPAVVLPDTLPNGTVCTPYDAGLPPNVTVMPGPPSTPTKPGPYPVTVTIPAYCPLTRTYAVTVDCPQITFTPLPPTLPPATVGVQYENPFSAAGGQCSYTLTSTPLPPGFTGLLSGFPTTAGPYPITVTATHTDSGCTATADYVLIVNPAPVVTPGADIPTLTEWGVLVMLLLLAAVAARRLT